MALLAKLRGRRAGAERGDAHADSPGKSPSPTALSAKVYPAVLNGVGRTAGARRTRKRDAFPQRGSVAVGKRARLMHESQQAAKADLMDAIAVVNAGSSSRKFSLFGVHGDALELAVHGQAEGLYTGPRFVARNAAGAVLAEKSWGDGATLGHEGALDYLLGFVRGELASHRLVGVGHRVVHGGVAYSAPVLVDKSVLATLEKLIPLAPLHQPHNLAPIRGLLMRSPQLPQVACFDTAFHCAQ